MTHGGQPAAAGYPDARHHPVRYQDFDSNYTILFNFDEFVLNFLYCPTDMYSSMKSPHGRTIQAISPLKDM